MDWIQLATQLGPLLQQGDLAECTSKVEEEIRRNADSPFHIVLNSKFTNSPNEIASHFDDFIAKESKRIKLGAIYTEANGFDVNPDCWYFTLFGFDDYGGNEDYDWISDWQSEDYPDIILAGMENLQKVYDSDDFYNEDYSKVVGLTSLLVVLRFQTLIKSSAALIKKLNCPVLVTAHDYDFIYGFSK